MKMDRRLANILIFGVILLYAVLEGYLLVFALETGKFKTLNLVMMIPLFILVIALLQRISIQTAVGFLLLSFWIPAGFDNWVLYLFEILLYLTLFLLLAIQFTRSGDEKLKSFLTNFPWFPFILYILGALLTWSISTKIGGELNEIRAMCIIPLAFFLVIGLTMRSAKDAEFFLWMILTSAAILGLLFLVGKNFSGFITLANYAAGSGRLSMMLSIPHVGSSWNAAAEYIQLVWLLVGICIQYLGISPFFVAPYLCSLFVFIIRLYGYYRTRPRGAITAALGAAIISVYAAVFGIRGVGVKFVFVCLAVIGGFWYLAAHSTNTISINMVYRCLLTRRPM